MHLRQLAKNEITKGRLKVGPALLLIMLADRIRDDIGELWASERKVASWIGRSQPTYRKWRAELIDADLMKCVRPGRPGVAGRYKIFPSTDETPGLSSQTKVQLENSVEQT